MPRTLVLAATIATLSTGAEGACWPHDLIGGWTMAAVGFSAGQSFVGNCDFTIAADGGLDGTCRAYDLDASFEGPIAGRLQVSRDCRVSGTFASQPGVDSDVQARLNLGKDVMTGISRDSGTVNQFTAVKAETRFWRR